MTHYSKGKATWQGGGAEGKRKAAKKKKAASPSSTVARNTMGFGKANMKADGAMGKHQRTGDGGASDFDT